MYDLLVDYLKEVLPADVSADLVGLVLLVTVFVLLIGAIVINICQLVKMGRIPRQHPPREVPVTSERDKQIREIISEDPLPEVSLPQQTDGAMLYHGEEPANFERGVTVMDESGDDEQGNEAGGAVYMKPGTLPGLVLQILLPDGRVNRCCLQAEVLKSLPGEVVLIGRSIAAQVQFRDKTVSYRHLHLGADEHGYWVEDVGSSNGTFLNGTECVAHRRYPLKSGDALRLGNAALKVQLEFHPS